MVTAKTPIFSIRVASRIQAVLRLAAERETPSLANMGEVYCRAQVSLRQFLPAQTLSNPKLLGTTV
jgi:hypothetical protein